MQQQQQQSKAAVGMDISQASTMKWMKVRDLTGERRRLVEVPYTATLSHTLNALVANRVVAVPVAAPPGQWIGAGGSMILESDKQSGAVRKHYIGMITMLDILSHIAGTDGDDESSDAADLDGKMSVQVSSVIGHCLESLSLWTLSPNTSILDCMEVFSKGIHRALVPVDGQMENVPGVELVESATSYQMLTQMDVLKFLKDNAGQLEGVLSQSVGELGAVTENVYAVTNRTSVIEAIKCMRAGSLTAVPIIEASGTGQPDEDPKQLVYGRERRLTGTFSATDLKGCSITQLQSWLSRSVQEFTEELARKRSSSIAPELRLVACKVDSRLGEAVEKAVAEHVHRVWVVDDDGLLHGLVSLTDMIRVIRIWMLSYPFGV